jgi:UDP-glucose 4-epimerase
MKILTDYTNYANQQILITGGAGAIGSNLVKILLKADAKITIIDNLSSGLEDNIDIKDDNLRFINGDINDFDVLNVALSGDPSYVFHLAAHFANQNSVDHPLADMETNIGGTIKLLSLLKNRNNLRRFIYTSSSCVYGQSSGVIDEDTPIDLSTPYSISKLTAEYYVHFYQRLYSIPSTILRYFNSFGPGEAPGVYRNVIPNFISLALQNESLPIYGDGSDKRCFTYVDDICYGTLLAAASDAAISKTFNIGSTHELSIIDLANLINRLTSNSSSHTFLPRRDWDHIRQRFPSCERAKNLFSYMPNFSLEAGLIKTISWFKSKIHS